MCRCFEGNFVELIPSPGSPTVDRPVRFEGIETFESSTRLSAVFSELKCVSIVPIDANGLPIQDHCCILTRCLLLGYLGKASLAAVEVKTGQQQDRWNDKAFYIHRMILPQISVGASSTLHPMSLKVAFT